MTVEHIASDLQALATPMADLYEDPANARTHSNRNIEAIMGSLRRFGQRKPIVAAPDGRILAGNGTFRAAKELGWSHLAVTRFDGDPADLAAYALADNRTAELAEWDEDALKDLLGSLPEDLQLDAGWDADELADLLGPVDLPPIQEPEAPPLPEDPTTKPGDIIRLGEHVLLCGDATQGLSWKALTDAGMPKVDLLWTDPPYGVSQAGKNERLNKGDGGHRNTTPILGDDLDADALHELWRDVFALAEVHAKAGAAYYVTGPAGPALAMHMSQALEQAGWLLKQQLVWVKNNHVLGGSDYHYKHEPIFYGWSKGKHTFHGGRSQFSVWEVDRPQASPEHPTMKPVELVARSVQNSTKPGGVVLDPFMGSGTTILACQQLGRRAFGIELSPAYCDVVVARWEEMTGEEVVR